MEYFDVLNSNGEYINKVESRDVCHKEGLWHKAVVVFILSSDNNKILLQQRSKNKKLWPNLWDITGGHVLSGELGYNSVIRECKEEIGIELNKNELEFIGATTSTNIKDEIVNNHFNEYYICHKDIDINDITLQEEEVQDIKWFSKDELLDMIHDNYRDLTDKVGCWNYLEKYFELVK